MTGGDCGAAECVPKAARDIGIAGFSPQVGVAFYQYAHQHVGLIEKPFTLVVAMREAVL